MPQCQGIGGGGVGSGMGRRQGRGGESKGCKARCIGLVLVQARFVCFCLVGVFSPAKQAVSERGIFR